MNMENEVMEQELTIEEVEIVQPTAQEKFSAALRELASFYDAHPEIDAPDWGATFTIYNVSKENLPRYAKAFGALDKEFDDYSFKLVKHFPENIKLQTYSARETVCERIKIGEEIVPAHVVPAKPAEEEKFVEEAVKEVYEWKCPGSILAGGNDGD